VSGRVPELVAELQIEGGAARPAVRAGGDRADIADLSEGHDKTAKQAGLVGRRRVLDLMCLYDTVATMDTVTLVRSAVRGGLLLGACPSVAANKAAATHAI